MPETEINVNASLCNRHVPISPLEFILFFFAACGPNNDCVSGLCNGTICCSESCLGGCTGPTSTECVACKHVVQYPRSEDKMRVCSDTCSLGTIKVIHNDSDASPNHPDKQLCIYILILK